MLGAPVKLLHIQLEAALELGENIQSVNAFHNDLWPNAITWYDSDLIVSHESSCFCTRSVLCYHTSWMRVTPEA